MPFCLSHFSVNCIRWHTITSRRAHTKYACMMYSWPDERVCVYLTCVWWAANFEIVSVHASAFPWSRTSRFRRFFDAVLQHTPSRFGPEKFQTRRPRRGLWSPNLCLQVQDTDSCRTRSPRASFSLYRRTLALHSGSLNPIFWCNTTVTRCCIQWNQEKSTMYLKSHAY